MSPIIGFTKVDTIKILIFLSLSSHKFSIYVFFFFFFEAGTFNRRWKYIVILNLCYVYIFVARNIKERIIMNIIWLVPLILTVISTNAKLYFISYLIKCSNFVADFFNDLLLHLFYVIMFYNYAHKSIYLDVSFMRN